MSALGRRLAAITSIVAIAAAGLIAAPVAQAQTVTLTIECSVTRTYTVNTFVAKADDLAVTASNGSCDGFDRPNGNFNFSGDTGSFTSSGGSITFENRKQQSALSDEPLLVSLSAGGSVTITINNANGSATTGFSKETPTDGTTGSSYSYTFEADGSPVTYSLGSGSLPPGLTLATDGELAGTPTTAGTYTFTVDAYNSSTEDTTPSATVNMTISAPSTWSAASPPAGVIGSDFGTSGNGYQFDAGLAGATTYTVSSGTLPPGLTLSDGGLLGSGEDPTQVGDYTFELSANDGSTTSLSGDITISVTAPEIDKVTICHRTRATTNPYVLITVSINSVIGSGGRNGHGDHNTTRTNSTNPTGNGITPGSGPFDTSFSYPNNQKWWGDIIPPFTYSGGTYSGMNWSSDWDYPDPTGGTSTWLEDGEFATAISGASGVDTSSTYYKAAEQCLDLSSGQQSTKSAEMDDPQKYFNVSVENGEDPDSIREDLEEQEAEAMGGGTPGGTPITIPTAATLQTSYNSTASVVTDPATDLDQTSATLNGTLKNGTSWTDWKLEWATSAEDVAGSSDNHSSTTIPGGSGDKAVDYEVTGLTCNTEYFYRVVGNSTEVGLIESFTTSACNSGGGNGNGNGNSGGGASPSPEPETTTPTTPAPGRGRGRQPQLTVPNAGPANAPVTPGNSSNPNSATNSGNSANTPAATGTTGSSGSPAQPANPVASVNRPRNLTPTNSVPAPTGTTWEPTQTRIQDPETGLPVLRVTNEAGTWQVDEQTGEVTFTPAPGYAGTATVNVVLSARSGEVYVHPMRVPISFTSRVRIQSGDVPGDISGGVLRIIRPWQR